METSAANSNGVRWDLSDLYSGPEDPRIESDIAAASRRAHEFAQTYRDRLAGFDGATLSRVLAEYEALSELLYRPSFYAGLLFAGDTQSSRAQQLVQHTREATTATANLMIFFPLELVALGDEQVAGVMAAAEMAGYAHYLDMLRRFKPHTLTEKEEQLLNQKSLTGRSAFEQLYDELSGSLRFKITVNGEERELTDSEVMALQRLIMES